jgi:hypothetical protein
VPPRPRGRLVGSRANAPVVDRLRQQLRERGANAVEAALVCELMRFRSGHEHDVVPAGEPLGVQRTCLTQQAFDLVSRYRTTDLAPDGEADARRLTAFAREYVKHEVAIRDRATGAVDAIELGASR